ncbi:MAG: OST-HTH/LOTUS domain-containing protein [Chthoniobacteraceae bacterium]
MAIDLYSKEDLISAVKYAPKPVAFLLGSPISKDTVGGVPGIDQMLDLVREEINARGPDQRSRFEREMIGKSGAGAYQAAMRWLQGNFTQDAVNHVVEVAVLKARRAGAPETFQDIGEIEDWYLPTGTQQVSNLVAHQRERFPGPILTTNFDPLLSVAVDSEGGRASWHILDSDGHFGRTAGLRRGEIQIIHLHGYWRDADTLHTPAQLTSERPKLHASLQHLLRQKTLLVAAYGGWDDAFTKALARLITSGHPDDVLGVNVLWCFYEDNAALVESRYKHIFDQMPSSRFLAYGGIDCHSIFGEIAGATGSGGIFVQPTPNPTPIAGWEAVTETSLSKLPALGKDEVIKYFDGAVPTWRHALSDKIPRRQTVAQILERLKTFQPAQFGCSLQLIRAAGGEGKTTLLLQSACDAVRTGEWTVLWRTLPSTGLPPKHVVGLDPSKLWLIVADDAEDLVTDLTESARLLHEAGRSNVHFLIASRDADWWAKFGDKPPWEQWLTAWVRRKDAIMLRGMTRDDAKKVTRAWAVYGAQGLRQLDKLSEDEQVESLLSEVRNALYEEQSALGRHQTFEGSFFGALLSVRFGQDGLQSHVRSFLNRLREEKIRGSECTLFDALVYVAACHAISMPGLNETVLADLLCVPRDWVQSLVIQPLGAEAAAVRSAGNVLTRHEKVAIAIILEADQTLDLGDVWSSIVRQTVKTGLEVRIGPTYATILHAGPRLFDALPAHFSAERRAEISISAAKAAIKYNSQWLGCVVSLGKTYRKCHQVTNAVKLFREMLKVAEEKVDFSDHIRGYWHEWGVCEGLLGDDPQHRAADSWLQGLSISDHLNPAPLTEENIKQSCASLGIALGILAREDPHCPYHLGRRATVFIGRLTSLDPKSAGYFDKFQREEDRIDTPTPHNPIEAVSWIQAAIVEAGRELEDQLLREISDPRLISFQRLQAFLDASSSGLYLTAASSLILTPNDKLGTNDSLGIINIEREHAPARMLPQPEGRGDDLRTSVSKTISSLIEKSILKQRPLLLPVVGKVLATQFGQHCSIYEALGFRDLTNLVLSFDEFVVTGAHPKWLVSFREDWQTTTQNNLRYGVWTAIREMAERAAFNSRPLYLNRLGLELGSRFPDVKPIHLALGYPSLWELVESFRDFEIGGEHPRWVVEPRSQQKALTSTDLRSEVAATVSYLIERHNLSQQPLLLLVIGNELARRFPEAKPVHKSLGFATLTDLILSFDNFTVSGEHPSWIVKLREEEGSIGAEDLRLAAESAIANLIERSMVEERPLYLPFVGYTLAEMLPRAKPIHIKLGFQTLTELVESFKDFTVCGEHPRWFVTFRKPV